MRIKATIPLAVSVLVGLVLVGVGLGSGEQGKAQAKATLSQAQRLIEQGRQIFRYDTFGDEQLWTDVLRMHEVIATVPPATALAVGLKVDVEALPPAVIAALQAGQVDLTNPAVTVELIR